MWDVTLNAGRYTSKNCWLHDSSCIVIPVWYLLQIDRTGDPQRVKSQAEKQGVICISAINGDGLEQFCNAIQTKLKV